MLPYTPRAHVGGALTGHYRAWWVRAPGYHSRSAYEVGGKHQSPILLTWPFATWSVGV